MSAEERIKAPIVEEMKTFDKFFQASMKSRAPLLNLLTNYVLRTKGKQMRPMFVLLSAKINGGITQKTYHAATLIELMHTATLIHDDVVDDSFERRGFFSINALWKNKIAVLLGDYLLAKGLLLAVDNGEFEMLKIVSETVKEMSEGELIQIEKSRKLDISEEVYFDIIRKKTATLIAACTAGGALSAGADAETIQKMKIMGENIGIGFQIKDDIFDYQPKGILGKPTGNDIQEKKMTLPLIYALNNATDSEKSHIIQLVRKYHKKHGKVKEVIDFVNQKKGIEYATERMNGFRNNAMEILNSFPNSEAKSAMEELVNYSTSRKK